VGFGPEFGVSHDCFALPLADAETDTTAAVVASAVMPTAASSLLPCFLLVENIFRPFGWVPIQSLLGSLGYQGIAMRYIRARVKDESGVVSGDSRPRLTGR
jgi:hypothetical protein